jgi:hypothetical protein
VEVTKPCRQGTNAHFQFGGFLSQNFCHRDGCWTVAWQNVAQWNVTPHNEMSHDKMSHNEMSRDQLSSCQRNVFVRRRPTLNLLEILCVVVKALSAYVTFIYVIRGHGDSWHAVVSTDQGCQMVCFQTKNPNLSKFWRVKHWGMLVYFTDTWSILRSLVICILWTFGIVCGKLEYLFPFWYFVPRKIWQPCYGRAHRTAKHCPSLYISLYFYILGAAVENVFRRNHFNMAINIKMLNNN